MQRNRGITVEQVSRDFGGARVLHDVGFDVAPGRMTGFVGANGAGKTTTMRIIMGVLAPSTGRVLWDGDQLTADQRRSFGYMPEERGLYPKMKVAEQLRYFARLHGVDPAAAARRVGELLERLALADRADDVLETLSLGNQQRVQIAAALVHDPVALVLDEPFSGLDPLAVDLMAELLRERVRVGVPVLFSSHQLELVERLCDDLVIVSSGRVVAAGSVDELRAKSAAAYTLHVSGDEDLGWVRSVEGVRVLDVVDRGTGQVVVFETDREDASQAVLREALGRGHVHELRRRTPSISEIFREAVA
jgi:ABC-2 type transport system ATP-binding protein